MEYIIRASQNGKPKGYVNLGSFFGCPFLDLGKKADAKKFKTKKEAQNLERMCKQQGLDTVIEAVGEEVKK